MAVLTYKCPNCGGPLTWDGTKEKYVCEYCGSSFTQAELKALQPSVDEEEEVETMEQTEDGQFAKIKVYNCPSCGAQIVTDDTTTATVCFYCKNPVVLSDKFEQFNPDFIIPFAINRKEAEGIFKKWVSEHKYVPDVFTSQGTIEQFNGVYFPYWVYNASVTGNVAGEGRINKITVSGDIETIKTSVYAIDKTGTMKVENVSRIALNKASKELCESVMPFELDGTKKFDMGYLQGYLAENRDIPQEEIADTLRSEVRSFALSSLESSSVSGFDQVKLTSKTADIHDERWQYGLMPVWTLTYKERGSKNIYYFSINGQTGKTCGELPTDSGKLRGLFLKTFLPTLAALLALMYFVL